MALKPNTSVLVFVDVCSNVAIIIVPSFVTKGPVEAVAKQFLKMLAAIADVPCYNLHCHVVPLHLPVALTVSAQRAAAIQESRIIATAMVSLVRSVLS